METQSPRDPESPQIAMMKTHKKSNEVANLLELEKHKQSENSESHYSKTSVCVMGKKVWVNAAFWNAGEQTLNQGYNTFQIHVGQVSKTIILIFIKKNT